MITMEEIRSKAYQKLIGLIKDMAKLCRERDQEFKLDHVGPVVHYPNRWMNSDQKYRLEELVPMAMIAALTDKPFINRIIEEGKSGFIQPFVDFEGTEPKLDDVFLGLNESLDKFLRDNPIENHKAAWRYAPEPGLNDDRRNSPFAHISNLYSNGAYTDLNFARDFLFFNVIRDCVEYEIKTRMREGSTVEYKYAGLSTKLHEEYYGTSRKVFEDVQSEMLKIVFREEHEFTPQPKAQ